MSHSVTVNQLFIQLLCTASVPVLWVLGVSGNQSAEANPPDFTDRHWQQQNTEGRTNLPDLGDRLPLTVAKPSKIETSIETSEAFTNSQASAIAVGTTKSQALVQLAGQPTHDIFQQEDSLIQGVSGKATDSDRLVASSTYTPTNYIPPRTYKQPASVPNYVSQNYIPTGVYQQPIAPPGYIPTGYIPTGAYQQPIAPPGYIPTGYIPAGAYQQPIAPPGYISQNYPQNYPGAYQQPIAPPGYIPTGVYQQQIAPPGYIPQGYIPTGGYQQQIAPPGYIPQNYPGAYQQQIAPPGYIPTGAYQQPIAPPGYIPQNYPGAYQQPIAPPGYIPTGAYQQPIAPPGYIPTGAYQQPIAPPGYIPTGAYQQPVAPPGYVAPNYFQYNPATGYQQPVAPSYAPPNYNTPARTYQQPVAPSYVPPNYNIPERIYQRPASPNYIPTPATAYQPGTQPAYIAAPVSTAPELGMLRPQGGSYSSQPLAIPAESLDPYKQNLGQLPTTQIPPLPLTPSRSASDLTAQSNVNSTNRPFIRSTALSEPSLQLQGVYINQAGQSSARARLATLYPLTPRVLFGATVDLTTGSGFTDSRQQGLSLNELYLATSLDQLPNVRFAIGQLDLTSYFDRNSFAKDAATHFFNPVFQTNPALSATGISSRPGVLVNWTVTDNIEAKAAVFSSGRAIGNFALDAFAAEVGIRSGNAIIRGTFASDRDAGSRDGFRQIFQIPRATGETGPLPSDREESFGINGELFIPNLKMGIFGRYGRYDNRDLRVGGDTYNIGVSFLDVFNRDDRLGLAYGRDLSNDQLLLQARERQPDVVELFYDFRFLDNLRLGFSIQRNNGFSETVLGFRLKTEFNVTPINRQFR